MTSQTLKDLKQKLVKQTKSNKNLAAGYPDHFDLKYSTLNCKVYIYFNTETGSFDPRAVILHHKNVDKNELKFARNNLMYQFKGIDPNHIFTSQFTPKKDTK